MGILEKVIFLKTFNESDKVNFYRKMLETINKCVSKLKRILG